jgi:hypothetical protein
MKKGPVITDPRKKWYPDIAYYIYCWICDYFVQFVVMSSCWLRDLGNLQFQV